MKTTFKAILASELLAVCSETTERQRVKPKEEGDKKFSESEVEKILSSLASWSGDAKNQLMKAFSLLFHAPELEVGQSAAIFDLFSVVVCEKNVNSHAWGKKAPFIIIHSKNQFGLTPDGNTNVYYRDNDKPRLATADEIVKCIENLTDVQWNKIRTDPLFSPIVATAMNMEVMIDENEVILTEADRQAAAETP